MAGKFSNQKGGQVFIQSKHHRKLPPQIQPAEEQFSGMRGAQRLAHRWGSDTMADAVLQLASDYATERLPKEFEHELEFLLGHLG
jgi:hypothetical protein